MRKNWGFLDGREVIRIFLGRKMFLSRLEGSAGTEDSDYRDWFRTLELVNTLSKNQIFEIDPPSLYNVLINSEDDEEGRS